MSFAFKRLAIPDVVLVEPTLRQDERGWFMETTKASAFAAAGLPDGFAQTNHSRSARGVTRGLHYQIPPAAQGKLVRCVRGAVYDVAVDVRPGSPSFGRFVAAHLSEENRHALWIPPGFAHGFQALTDDADVLYHATAEYAPHLERTVRWDDPEIGIPWPVPGGRASARDAQAAPLAAVRLAREAVA